MHSVDDHVRESYNARIELLRPIEYPMLDGMARTIMYYTG